METPLSLLLVKIQYEHLTNDPEISNPSPSLFSSLKLSISA